MIYIAKSELQTQQIRPYLHQRLKRLFENARRRPYPHRVISGGVETNAGATMNTLYHRERILMSRLLLEMCRRASRYVEGKSLGAKMEAVLILIAIALGYMEGRPFTASKLAAYLDTPRTSVLRKLAQLKREGFVEQRGHTYVLHDHLLNSVGIEDTRAAIRMIRSLAEQLIQFDNEGVQNGHESRPQNHQRAHIKAA